MLHRTTEQRRSHTATSHTMSERGWRRTILCAGELAAASVNLRLKFCEHITKMILNLNSAATDFPRFLEIGD